MADRIVDAMTEGSAQPFNGLHLRIEKDARDWATIMGGQQASCLRVDVQWLGAEVGVGRQAVWTSLLTPCYTLILPLCRWYGRATFLPCAAWVLTARLASTWHPACSPTAPLVGFRVHDRSAHAARLFASCFGQIHIAALPSHLRHVQLRWIAPRTT